MPKYNSEYYDPPAPVAHVTLHNTATGASVSDVPMLMDTGADVTLLPRKFVEQMGILPVDGLAYQVVGFNGGVKLAEAVKLELTFLERRFKGQFLLLDESIGIMGRNILNAVTLVIDGPRGEWTEQKRQVN